MTDLLDTIDWSSLECLNAKPDKGIENALKQGYREDDGLFLESDTDEQILIHIPFSQAVRLSGIAIKSTAKPTQAPKVMKLFVNRPTIGFAEAAESSGVQDFDLAASDLTGETLKLRLVKFSRVNCLTLFIESNQDDEETTVIQKISILGNSGDRMEVADLKDISKEEN